jgi:hypothetical protein
MKINKALASILASITLLLTAFAVFRIYKDFEEIVFAMEDDTLSEDLFDL